MARQTVGQRRSNQGIYMYSTDFTSVNTTCVHVLWFVYRRGRGKRKEREVESHEEDEEEEVQANGVDSFVSDPVVRQ